MSTKKIFNFYYDLCCQKLTVYSGTSAEEIKSTIREILEIPQDKQVRYLDEEGNPIVISSALPDQIKIYVEIKKTFTEKFLEENKAKNDNNNTTTTSTPNSIKWVWNKDDENDLEYKNSNEDKTVKHCGDGMGFAKGTLIMEEGEYYYTILFEPLQCCVFGSVCDINTTNGQNVDWFDFWTLWPDYPDPHVNFPGPVINAGFYVNMNKKLLIVYDHNNKKEIKRINFKEEWKNICPCVYFKHGVSITVSSDALKSKPDFVSV